MNTEFLSFAHHVALKALSHTNKTLSDYKRNCGRSLRSEIVVEYELDIADTIRLICEIEKLLRSQAESVEMQDDYRAEKRAEGDDEVRESRRHADEALGYEHG